MADGRRKLTVFASIYTLIQGLLWFSVAIFCIFVYKCIGSYPHLLAEKSKDSLFYTLLYTAYLNGDYCADGPRLRNVVNVQASTRTFVWMSIYGVLSSLWMFFSLLLAVSSLCKLTANRGFYMYMPWIIVTGVIVVTDVVASLYYVFDVFRTLTPDEYIYFLGESGTWESVTGYNATGVDTAAPSVALTLFFSRAVIFWFVNAALLFHVFRESMKIKQLESQGVMFEEEENKYRTWNRPIISPQFENRKRSFRLEAEPKNWKGVAARREFRGSHPDVAHPSPDAPHSQNGAHSHRVTYKVDEFGIPIEEVLVPRPEVDVRSPRPRNEQGQEVETPIMRPVVEAHLLKRPSFRGGNAQVQSPELRGQVPWSYLRPSSPPQTNSPAPRPIIPEPDYGIPTRPLAYPYVLSRPTPVTSSTTQTRGSGHMY